MSGISVAVAVAGGRGLPRGVALAVAMWLACGPATAQHRVTPGDALAVALALDESPIEAVVDMDGSIRLPGLGQIAVEGLTLDEVEARAAARAAETQLYVRERVWVTIRSHAPVLVVGDVRAPGAYEFRPALTVAAALGLAGGPTRAVLDPAAAALMGADLAAEARAIDADLARSNVRLRRLTAQRDEVGVLNREDLRPLAASAAADEAIAVELDLFLDDRRALEEMQSYWTRASAELEEEIGLLTRRVANQAEVVAILDAEYENARELVARGVRPSNELPRFERFATEARARLLEIETALGQSRLRRTNLAQDRVRFVALRRAAILEALSAETATLGRQIERRRAVADKQALVGLGRVGLGSVLPVAAFRIDRRVNGALQSLSGSETTPLLPGDVLHVRLALGLEDDETPRGPDAALSRLEGRLAAE